MQSHFFFPKAGDINSPIFFYLILKPVAAFGSHLGQLICLHLKKFNSGTILIKSDQNTIMFSRDIDI